MKNPISLFLSVFLLTLFFCQSGIAQTPAQKAALIYEIAQNAKWSNPNPDFVISILDAKEVEAALKTLANGKKIDNRTIAVKRISFNFQVKPCEILFIGESSSANTFFGNILSKVQGTPTLIITEKPEMLQEGSHINFLNQNNVLRYEMNSTRMQASGIIATPALVQKSLQNANVAIKEPEDNKVDFNIFKKREKDAKDDKPQAKPEPEEKPEPEPETRESRRNRKNKKTAEVEEHPAEILLEKAAENKNITDQQVTILKNYIAALERKLDENKIDYQNLKSEYASKQTQVEAEIKELNLTIIEKDSLRKKDQLLAERKIELAESAKKIALIQSRNNWYLALLAGTVALALLGTSYLFYRDNKIIKQQRNDLAENLEEIQQQKEEIEAQRDEIERQKNKSDELLLNILPAQTAFELKETGKATPQQYELASVLFTDFRGFTGVAEKLTPEQIIEELNLCFSAFDEITEKHNLERIKTIGDSYMCAGGLPIANESNPYDIVRAGLEMQSFMETLKKERIAQKKPYFECRLGIHSGKVVAGVIGKKKFAYDIWGDTVNLASRLESSGEVGKVNISGETYQLVQNQFACEYRGKVNAKGKGEVDMYFVKNALV
ncbi:MAG: YfiR/HmsC family protein [Microscillaceae bacterium]|jgi:class 3 adenylate cyclase|nr:YfiR/HmsC family protein [Microscillaceae bacterium]